jgi:hypothetical protein
MRPAYRAATIRRLEVGLAKAKRPMTTSVKDTSNGYKVGKSTHPNATPHRASIIDPRLSKIINRPDFATAFRVLL